MVLGIVGTHGAGKGAVVQFLKEHGFIHCSARTLLLEELVRQGITPDRPAISAIAVELRTKHGVDYVVRTFLERYDPATFDVVIESIYTMGEAAAIRKAGGYVLSVDADPEARYERIKHRMSETDLVTKEEFMKRQEFESRANDDVGQDARTVMEDADFHIDNNEGIEELKIQVDYMLEKMAQNKDI